MAWRVATLWAVMVGAGSVGGCAPATRASLVPRLVVHLSAADRQARPGDAVTDPLRRGRWDVWVRADLRWRTSPPSSSWPAGWPSSLPPAAWP